jgi:5-formyltetrahydrofolate cyclo-ligase
MLTSGEQKSVLRKKMLATRIRLNTTQVLGAGKKVWKKLKILDCFKKARTVMFYVSAKNEVDTHFMIKRTIDMGKKVVVPYLIRNEIAGSVLKNLGSDLAEGCFGIPEPKKERRRKICEKKIELVIIPAVAFDAQGSRLGFGKGCYDKFLKKMPLKAKFIGIGYDFQVLKKLPKEKHDILMDAVLTEKRVIRNVTLKEGGHTK